SLILPPQPPPRAPLFPYTTLFRSVAERKVTPARQTNTAPSSGGADRNTTPVSATPAADGQSVRGENAGGHGEKVSKKERAAGARSEEHTSELQSRENLVCRLLLEK